MQRSRLLFTIGAILNCSYLPVVHAQSTTAATGEVALEEIVVTAEKRPENLQTVPVSIQVFTGEQLREEGKKRIDEILDGVVGVQSQGAEVGTSFYMRGVGTDRGQAGNFGSGPTQQAVATIIDGVYAAQQEIVRGGSADIAQVEVMRGPQSTSLGGSSLAGAVNITTNDPAFKYQTEGTVEVGNYNKLSFEGVFNAPLSDNQALRFVVSTDRRDSYLSAGNGDSDLLNARLKYRWQINDNINLVVTASHQTIGGAGVTLGVLSYEGFYTPYEFCIGQSVPTYTCGTGAQVRGYPPTYAHVDTSTTYLNRSNPWDDGMPENAWGHDVYWHTILNDYNIKLTWNLGIGTLTVIPAVENGSLKSAEGDNTSFYVLQRNKYDTRQIDAHLDSNAESTIKWLVGANYFYSNTPGSTGFVSSPGAGPPFPCATGGPFCYAWVGIGESSQTTKAVYANTTIPIISTLRAIAGVRYTKDSKSGQPNSNGNVTGSPSGPNTPFTWSGAGTADWSHTNYSLGVEYDLREQSMIYARYSTGYQPGNILVANPGPGFTSTKEQTISQLTLGIKNRFFDNKLQFNVEAFDSLYHNRGAQADINVVRTNSLGNGTTPSDCVVPPGPPPAITVAADYTCLLVGQGTLTIPDLKSRGVDFEVNWLPSAADRIDATLEYLQATQSSPVPATAVTLDAINGAAAASGPPLASHDADAAALLASYNAQVASYEGATLQSSPKWSGNLTYQHEFAMPSGAKLTPRLNVQYKSSYWTAAQGLTGVDANGVSYSPSNPGPAEQSSYELYNAYLIWNSPDNQFTATGYVRNIDNKPVLQNYGAANSFRGAASVDLDAPRTFGLILSAKF